MHLGERELWREGSSVFIHSDTLFSGLCHCYTLLYGEEELEKFITAIKNENAVQISSAFPLWDDNFYWPIPKNQIPEDKTAYKVKFIEQNGFEKLLVGERLENLIKAGIKIIPRNEKPHTPWKLDNIPRISLNRFNNHPLEEGGFFHLGRITYHKSAGFFFLYNIQESSFEIRFKAALRLLAAEGIGGYRSCGNGQMKILDQNSFGTINLNLPQNTDGELNLSLYYPARQIEEIKTVKAGYYELLERKGYIYSPYGITLRRRSLRMITEGSVFPAITNRTGSLENVKPDIFKNHSIYRYGLFFGLPCKKEVNP